MSCDYGSEYLRPLFATQEQPSSFFELRRVKSSEEKPLRS
jgi:hypothetical protein